MLDKRFEPMLSSQVANFHPVSLSDRDDDSLGKRLVTEDSSANADSLSVPDNTDNKERNGSDKKTGGDIGSDGDSGEKLSPATKARLAQMHLPVGLGCRPGRVYSLWGSRAFGTPYSRRPILP